MPHDKLLISLALIVVLSIASIGQTRDPRSVDPNYTSDKCSMFPDGNYADCCVAHDAEYFFGGSLKERKASDKRLRECVRSKNPGWKGKLLANAMYLGVRIGAVSFLPTPFRWGFGNKWPRKRPENVKDEKKSTAR